MSNIKYHITANGERVSITVIGDDIYTADSDSHANINTIIEAAVAGDESVYDLFDMTGDLERRFDKISDRISIQGEAVYLDNDPAPKAISDAIYAHYQAGTDGRALVNFLEKLANNPSKHSVEQLYPWLDATDGFTVTEDGDLIAYKGVAVDENGNYVSVNHGKAIVNGVEVTGAIPNDIGDVVEMPRSEVTADSYVGCAQGLHAGTYEYASGWARGGLLEVLIDPRDVVSVPTDCGAQKLRTCRYTVLDTIEQKRSEPVRGFVNTSPADYYEEWGDFEDEHRDFEVGDDVEIVDDLSGYFPEAVGMFGVITDITGRIEHPYRVSTQDGWNFYCSAEELEFA